jgi:hypothetical protein
MIFLFIYLKFNEQMIILFLFNNLTIKTQNNQHLSSVHNIIFLIYSKKSLLTKIKIISLLLIVENLNI